MSDENKMEVEPGCGWWFLVMIFAGVLMASMGMFGIGLVDRLDKLNSTIEKCLIVPADAGSEEEK